VWRVYGFLAYRLSDRQVAEDLTQITFERALRAWSRYDARRAPVAAWLLQIASNVLIDHHRRDRGPMREPLHGAPEASTPGPEQRFSGSPDLLVALDGLDEREREILALRYGADLTGQQVAGLLGLSLANVQQIASRALRRLREQLEPARTAPID
jgi:RNA polymerase sigma-70 factor (ECF subfamily)